MAAESSAPPPKMPLTLGKPESDEEYDDMDQCESGAETDETSRDGESAMATASDDDASSGKSTDD